MIDSNMYLENDNIFFKYQFGFRANHSTNHALTEITEQIRNVCEKDLGPLLFIVFINDLKKSVKILKVHHYADNTNLLLIEKSLKKLINK